MSRDLVFKTATQLGTMIRQREISSAELTELFIQQIEAEDSLINAVCVRRFDEARSEALAADQALAKGNHLGPLHGLPMTIKESYIMKGTPTTWGIESEKDNIASSDGLIVERFRAAGAHFLGKTNVPVDLADTQATNPIYGTTNNPYKLDRTPGGSSGGSGAATAAGFTSLEAGSDIGGSIRIPAVFCGVFGHKPTWGIVPSSGHELVENLGLPDPDITVCGPLARGADDLALALDVMAGPKERERVGWDLRLPVSDITSLSGLRVAIWQTDELSPVSREVQEKVVEVGEALEKIGAKISFNARPNFDKRKAHLIYTSLTTATMASGQPEEVIKKIQRRVDGLAPDDDSIEAAQLRASVMSHREWIRQNFRREKLRRAWDEFFVDWDVLICPQFNIPAYKHDVRPMRERSHIVDGEERSYNDYSFWAGIANAPYLPSTAFPAGFSADGLPIGLQATCPAYRDKRGIEIARLITREIGGYVRPGRMKSG